MNDYEKGIEDFCNNVADRVSYFYYRSIGIDINQISNVIFLTREAIYKTRENLLLKHKFNSLKEQWKKETLLCSGDLSDNKHYREIIKMGVDVIPFILSDLKKGPNHWFVALSEITGENPVLEEHRGNIAKMTQDWLDWADLHGYY